MYDLYRGAVGGVAHDGTPLPTWEEFQSDPSKTKQAHAWQIVAQAAVDGVEQAAEEKFKEFASAIKDQRRIDFLEKLIADMPEPPEDCKKGVDLIIHRGTLRKTLDDAMADPRRIKKDTCSKITGKPKEN